ncbi:MAG: hypothetical protein ACYC27_00420 [Armatimonadota bacterium]
MHAKRITIYVVLGILIGAIIGPNIHVLYWTILLEKYPNDFIKSKAATRLGESEQGIQKLYDNLTSDNKAIRIIAAEELASDQKPYYVAHLLGKIPVTSIDERIQIIKRLDYGYQHKFVLNALNYEISHTDNKNLKSESEKVLQSLSEAGDEVTKTGNSSKL